MLCKSAISVVDESEFFRVNAKGTQTVFRAAVDCGVKSIYHRTKIEAETFLETEANSSLKVTTLRMSRCFPEPAPIMAMYRLHRGIDARDVAEGHRLATTYIN